MIPDTEFIQTGNTHGLSILGYKIMLDRYSLKDLTRSFVPGDIAICLINPDSNQRELGTVTDFDGSNVTCTLWGTNLEEITLPIESCDRPIEWSPEHIWHRVAAGASVAENSLALMRKYEVEFYKILKDWKFVPAGRIMAQVGSGQVLSAYNCYVLPSPKDSRLGILETLGQMTEIMSRGGGVGINLSTLRPRQSIVRGVNGRSSGAVSWGSIYSNTTGLIEQGGSRRGALMLILEDWHPDLIEFINAKKKSGYLTNANISVGLSNEFMKAVEEDTIWHFYFPDTTEPDYDNYWDGDIGKWVRSMHRIVSSKSMPAREIWNQITESAWASAEPGIWFIDKANEMSNSYYFDRLIATNPCGEQSLPGWGVCNLGAINLAKFVKDGEVDWVELEHTVRLSIRFLDNIIDINPYTLQQNRDQQLKERRIGLNTMGLADMLIQLGIRYGSDESIEFIDTLYREIANNAYDTSTKLAEEKGLFPEFDQSKILKSGFLQQHADLSKKVKKGLRNVTLLTQAPNGTIGTMVGTSTGIEPFFAFGYTRQSRLGLHLEHVKVLDDYIQKFPESANYALPDYFVTAQTITPEEHVKVQAAIQKWVDSSISKTVNLPSTATIEDVAQLYITMYNAGCKGGTVYRDQSRSEQVLTPIIKEDKCPDCGEILIMAEGCETCTSCGYSLCKV
jgi:ribonucleoside-diphosphate reductase alpha chain